METLVLATFAGLCLLALVIKCKQWTSSKGTEGQRSKVEGQSQEVQLWHLQLKFYSAYFLALFADWLQGPYIYQLYSSYGFAEHRIALLFLTGFASSSTFGTFTGPLADKFGRKKLTMVFCVLYATCCAIKFSDNFWILLGGRVVGGISTSLLFSVFESWYVSNHLELKLPAEWMSKTFATSTFANGVLAIGAGIGQVSH